MPRSSIAFTVLVVFAIGLFSIPSAFAYTISDDSTGGDCTQIGTWDSASKTCTLTGTINFDSGADGIIIGSNGITLDGNGQTIDGAPNPLSGAGAAIISTYPMVPSDGHYGILIDGKSNVTIKNIGELYNFHVDAVVKNSDNVSFINNNIPVSVLSSILVTGSNNITLTSNNFSSSTGSTSGSCVVDIRNSQTVTVNQNDLSGKSGYNGFCIRNSNDIDIDANIYAGGTSIGDSSSMGIGFIEGNPSSSNIQIRNMNFYNLSGELFIGGCTPSCYTTIVHSVSITGNTFYMSNHVITLDRTEGVTISDNIIKNSQSEAIWVQASPTGSHTITDNTFDNISGTAIYLSTIVNNQGHTITGNTFTNNNIGIWHHNNNNQISNNNFVGNAYDIVIGENIPWTNEDDGYSTSTSTFSQNYWSDFDSAAESCYNDTPFDKYCDTTFSFSTPVSESPPRVNQQDDGTQTITDSQPWVMQDGAMPSSPIPSPPDTQNPTVSTPGSQTFYTTSQSGMIVNYGSVSASDDRTVTSGPNCSPASGTLLPVGVTIITCTASDGSGNTATASFTVTVVNTAATGDTSPPTVSQLNTILKETALSNGAVVTYNLPTATDDEAVTYGPVCTPSSGSLFFIGSTTVTCIAKDAAGNQGTSSFSVIVVQPSTVIEEGTVSFQLDNTSYFTGDSIIVAGTSTAENVPVTLQVYSPSVELISVSQGGVVVSGSQTTSAQPEGSGSFATQILAIGPLWSEDGTYTVKASVGVVEATKTFNFTVRELDAVPFTSIPSNIALSINKSAYTGDETISINVALIGGYVSQPISIEVSDPVGTALFLQTVNTDSQARVSSQFTLPENVVSGTYTVSASSKGQLWDLTDSVAFTGIPLEPEVLDSSISVTNEQGAAVTTYNAGDLVYFSTKMTTKSTSQILVTVSVLDAQQNTLGVGFFKTVLPKGDAEIVLGFEIPEGTISGDAQVFTNFFTDWPDQGGISIGEEVSSKVNIIGVEPVEEVVEVLEEPVQMQVTVQNAPGSSFEGCEETNSCFLPYTVTIDVGGTVTWENPDDVPHTVTSGTSAGGPSGHFDSNLIAIGESFSNTFDEAGTYNYFCMIHPWMQGSVVVGGSDTVVEPVIEPEPVEEEVVEVVEEEPMPESSGMQATVQNAPGSSFEGCEPCFLPSTVTIDVGGTVTWENPDNAAHSTASFKGSISGVVGLEWDSGLMLMNQSFSHTFDTEGTYDYFCMVHPWMQGIVVVQGEEEEEEPPLPVQEEIIEVVDILALNGTSNIIFLTGTDYVEANKSSLNDEHEKLTVSSWVKPDFISTSTPQYSAVSKEGSFELFLTNTKDPERSPGFSVFDGQSWNTILIDSKVTEGWHHLAGVVNGEDLSLYLDSVLIGTKSIQSQTGYMAASENKITVGTLINSASIPIEILNSFQGSISEVNIITDALTSEQISNLYLTDKDMFQRDFVEVESVINGTVTTTLVTTESPELSADECIDLAKERGLYDQVGGSEAYTLVCQFPFDVIIPINSRLLWIETLSLENAPYHSIQSVDNLFSTGSMTSADMGFYDDTFTYGIYEYYDNFAESLTGKIIISKLTNSININVGSASPECADTNLCYDTFAAQVNVGEEVTWKNMDTFYHTVTSGTPGDGPDGLFDSGVFDTYLYFSYTFEEAGTYDYYCMIHPWKQGMVVVGEV